MKLLRLGSACVLWVSLMLLAGAAAAVGFVKAPAIDDKAQPFEIRFVTYDGHTNGQMVVEVVNASKGTATFVADGLYFVPKGDPEKAPQRLGAAGPVVEIADKKQAVHLEGVAFAPGERKRLRLEVFCIDSHRSSPNPKTEFRIANKRVPVKLRRQISTGKDRILRKNKGDLKKSKSELQQHMWQTRDADWVELEGERKQEKVQKRHLNQQRQQRRR